MVRPTYRLHTGARVNAGLLTYLLSDLLQSLSPVSRPEVPAKPSSQPAVSPSPYQMNQPAPMSYGQPVNRETISMMSQYGQPMSQQYPVGQSFQGELTSKSRWVKERAGLS